MFQIETYTHFNPHAADKQDNENLRFCVIERFFQGNCKKYL